MGKWVWPSDGGVDLNQECSHHDLLIAILEMSMTQTTFGAAHWWYRFNEYTGKTGALLGHRLAGQVYCQVFLWNTIQQVYWCPVGTLHYSVCTLKSIDGLIHSRGTSRSILLVGWPKLSCLSCSLFTASGSWELAWLEHHYILLFPFRYSWSVILAVC
jgi:hypothetical protein